MINILNIAKKRVFQVAKFSTDRLTRNVDEQKLLRELCGKIRFSGPITIAEYMREVLTNPLHGFYIEKNVLGKDGHFITSPEISQMFGECVAVWFLNEWMKMGEPSKFQLVELGPGKGTLMSDILRTIARISPNALEEMSVHLVDVSEKLKSIQASTLCDKKFVGSNGLKSIYGPHVSWYSSLHDVPKEFTFFVAHEFFDALAVNKFQRTSEGWREVLIDIDPSEEYKLRYVISRNPTPACMLLEQSGMTEVMNGRDNAELCIDGGATIRNISKRIVEKGGVGLIADYGHIKGEGDTFRAFRNHKQVHPLELPGTSDLTADVDFSYLKSQVSSDCSWFGPVTQEKFLHSCGITTRCQQLLNSNKDMYIHKNILESYDTLTNPEKMGNKFKFVGLFPNTMSEIHSKYPPVGFSVAENH